MIYIECKPDAVLVKSITAIPKKEIIHDFKGKYGVCKQLERRTNCKGLIDDDPDSIQPAYIRRLRLENDFVQHDLKVLHDKSKDNRLIVLCPYLEEWTLKAAKEAGIDVSKYGLPNNAKKLHAEINISLDNFERLLEDLKDSARLKALKRLLERE